MRMEYIYLLHPFFPGHAPSVSASVSLIASLGVAAEGEALQLFSDSVLGTVFIAKAFFDFSKSTCGLFLSCSMSWCHYSVVYNEVLIIHMVFPIGRRTLSVPNISCTVDVCAFIAQIQSKLFVPSALQIVSK